MSELVIVAADLYFAAGSLAAAPPDAMLPGLARMARFGTLESLPHGWRSWLAAWLALPQLAHAAPASVAALAAPSVAPADPARAPFVWLADPLHLTATLTSVHLSPHGVLRLEADAQRELCQAFNEAFEEVGYRLIPARAGRFLAAGPAPPGRIETTDPARYLGSTLADALPRAGEGAGALRRVSGELEMWLHEHPINARRAHAGRALISTLWLWGGGAPLGSAPPALASSAADYAQPRVAVFSDDAYVEGLSHLAGVPCAPSGATLAALGARREHRSVATVELFATREPPSQERSTMTPLRSLESLDEAWLVPALDELARGQLARVALIANDRCVSIAARDRWRLWRRPRAGLSALAAPAVRAAP